MTQPSPVLHIASPSLSADIATLGAELQNLCDADGHRLQWDGDPRVWSGRAPLLFPIVGMLAGGAYRLDGRRHPMPKHGFARQATFDVVSHESDAVVLRLQADDATRAMYPFEFQLDVAITIVDATVRLSATVGNHDTKPMPASFGFHPALRWPLPFGQPRADHFIRFEHDEPAMIRRIDADGLLLPTAQPTPVQGDVLLLRDELFDDDAMIFDRLASRCVSYGATEGPRLEVRFDGLPMLGVWTKPGGAEFICIEPWQGCADPLGYDGDIRDKPGIVMIEPEDSREFTMTIALRTA